MNKYYLLPLTLASFLATASDESGVNNNFIDISTCEELQNNLSNNSTDKFKLISDIDCSSTITVPFYPIQEEFNGVLEGNGYTIYDLHIASSWRGGIFNTLGQSSVIRNLNIVNANVESYFMTGTLASSAKGLIDNVYVNAYLKSTKPEEDYAPWGGIVGQLEGEITNSFADINMEPGSQSLSGGIVGQTFGTNAKITQSGATGRIVNAHTMGGIVGRVSASATIDKVYVNGMYLENRDLVTSAAGGLVGIVFGSEISNSYANDVTIQLKNNAAGAGLIATVNHTTGTVLSNTYANGTIVSYHSDNSNTLAAGMIAKSHTQPIIENSVSSLDIRGTTIIKQADVVLSNTYFNTDKSYIGNIADDNGNGATSEEFSSKHWYVSKLKWNNENWAFLDGYYPLLKDSDGNLLKHQKLIPVVRL